MAITRGVATLRTSILSGARTGGFRRFTAGLRLGWITPLWGGGSRRGGAAAGRQAAADLVKAYGQPFYTNDKGRVTGINERYWAGLYARENRVLFDPDEKTFYLYAEKSGLWEPVTPEAIREAISARILEVSRESQQF